MDANNAYKCDVFTKAFARQNEHFETAIQSLDSINDQIVQFLLNAPDDSVSVSDSQRDPRWSPRCRLSLVLTRRLLAEARAGFRRTVHDNQALASRIDRDLQAAHQQVHVLRAELADANRRLEDMAGNVITTCMPPPTATTNTVSDASHGGGASSAQSRPQHRLPTQQQQHPQSGHSRDVASISDKGGTRTTQDGANSKINDNNCSPQNVVDKSKLTDALSRSSSSACEGDVNRDSSSSSRAQQKGSMRNTSELNSASREPQTTHPILPHQDSSERPLPPPRLTSLGIKENAEVLQRNSPENKSIFSSSEVSRKSVPDDKNRSREISSETSRRNVFEASTRDGFSSPVSTVRNNLYVEKADSLTESSEGSESMAVAKHRVHKRERRSFRGSDLEKPSSPDSRSKATDDSKSELQRSESDGNQNSAPECDLSLNSSPFKEGYSKPSEKHDDDLKRESVRRSDSLSERKGSSELQRNSPPVRDSSNAQKRFSFSKDPDICLSKDTVDQPHKLKAKTKSDPLDQRRDRDVPEPSSVLSSPSAVMKHKSHGGNINWEGGRFFDVSSSWYNKPQEATTASSSMSGKSLRGVESSSNTSSSQDGFPFEYSDHPPRDEGRYVVFDSKDLIRTGRQWRTALSESYREQQQNDSTSDVWKNNICDKKDPCIASLKDERRQVPEKDESSPIKHSHEKEKFKKTADYSSYNSVSKESDGNLQPELENLRIRNSALLRDLEEVMESRDEKAKENAALNARLQQMGKEIDHAKEALSALKQDRKRLKAEKFDLLTQMKQLYSTLEDKEEELREFIRNYEHKMKENDESIKQLSKEREALEQEKWSILKRARDEAERAVLLCTQLGLKDQHIKELQDELSILQEKQASSAVDNHQTNGYGSPGARSYRATNGIDSHGTPTPTPGSEATTSPSFSGTPTISARYAEPATVQGSDLSPNHRPSLLSRSAEDIFNSSIIGGVNSVKKKVKEKKGTWGSISRVFSRSKRRKPLDPELFENNRASWSPKDSVCSSPLNEESYMQKLRLLEETHGTPMQHWRAATVLAWLEITMDMPQYATLCAENIKSGKVLLELSESELEEGLGISNVMHRRKLRLAIEEHRQPSLCRYPKICLMTHSWVVEEWLPSIALTCYLPSFSEHLVDGRVLDTLTKKDLEKHFGISRKFHQLSIMHAIQLLRMLNFDRQVLAQRRLNSENMDVDPLVWTNQRLIKWAISVDLCEYADNLRNTGVHGALAVLEPSFTADTIATALGIPTSKNIIRRHLTTEWQNLIQPARLSLESESLVAKKSKSEKRLSSGSSSISLVSQGRSGSSIMPSYTRRTLDRYDRKRSSWRFSTWKSSQESLKSTSSKKTTLAPPTAAERPHLLPLSPKLNTPRHRRTFSSHSDVETLTVTPV